MKTFTVQTRLNNRKSSELMDYLKNLAKLYTHIFLKIWRLNKKNGKLVDKSYYKTVMNKYNVPKRFAASVISDANSRYETMRELKKYELRQKINKEKILQRQVETLKEKINDAKTTVVKNKADKRVLNTYRRNKEKLFRKTRKLLSLKHEILKLEKEIKNNNFSVCFGTKRLFNAQYHLSENGFKDHQEWLNRFRKNRDKNILFVGSKEEAACNSLFQLSYKGSCYEIKVRTIGDNQKGKKYIYGSCKLKNELFNNYIYSNLTADKKARSPLTYRISIKDNKVYININFQYVSCVETNSDKNLGTVGLDYNDSFIQLSETNGTGNLVKTEKIDLIYHGNGNSGDSELKEKISKIVKYCRKIRKPLIVENLEFSKKRSELFPVKSKHGKRYNKMLSDFDYSRYKKAVESACYKNGVDVILINPAYTSKIARQKYCFAKKLGIHQGASFVIARKGQGFTDKYVA